MQIPGNAQEPVKMQESDKMKKSDKMQEQKKKSTTLNRIGKVDKKIRIRMWAAGIFFVCLVLVVLLQKFSLGQNYFVVTVNNKVVGCVSSKTNVEKAVHESRRQMAKESEGYLMQEISYETTESHKPFQKLLSETALKEKITKELKKENSGEIFAYTVSAGENQLSFATLDEVETFLGRLKEEQDTDNRFEVEFKKEIRSSGGNASCKLKRGRRFRKNRRFCGCRYCCSSLESIFPMHRKNPGKIIMKPEFFRWNLHRMWKCSPIW